MKIAARFLDPVERGIIFCPYSSVAIVYFFGST